MDVTMHLLTPTSFDNHVVCHGESHYLSFDAITGIARACVRY